jgi:hypothetical protein
MFFSTVLQQFLEVYNVKVQLRNNLQYSFSIFHENNNFKLEKATRKNYYLFGSEFRSIFYIPFFSITNVKSNQFCNFLVFLLSFFTFPKLKNNFVYAVMYLIQYS